MKTALVVLFAVVAAAACTQVGTDRTSQELCRFNPEDCLTPRQLADLEISSQADATAPGQTPVSKSYGTCGNRVCTVKWDFGSWYLITSCNSCSCNTDACPTEGPCMHIVPGPECMRVQ